MAKQGAGILSKPPKAKDRGKGKPKGQNLQGLTKQQNQIINQTQQGDLALGQTANQQIPGIQQNFEKPFNYQDYYGPAGDDYNGWIDNEMQTYQDAYDAEMNPQFQDQMGDFEQQMHNRGIPMGSELYDKEKTRLEKSQGAQRQQAYAANRSNAANSATQFFNIGSTANQNKFGMDQASYYQPLNNYNQLMGAQSGMGMQNLGYSQQRGLADQAGQIARSMPRGGGGGGGGTPPMYAQYGFSSPMEYDAYKQQQARDAQSWEWANNPQYKTPKGASPWASLGGQALGIGLGAGIGSLFR
jgi:hypothetical protein